MNRHERRKAKKNGADEMRELLFKVLRQGADNCVIVVGSSQGKLQLDRSPPTEFYDIPTLHEERLLALIDRQVLLTVHWDDGDSAATVSVVPADGKPSDEEFKTFSLSFAK
jgi:hypothetical protein